MTLPLAAKGDAATDLPTVAAFDFDGTLTRGGSIIPFLFSLRGVMPVLFAMLRTSPKLLRAALVGGSAADDSKELLLGRVMAGMPETTVDKVADEFGRRHLALSHLVTSPSAGKPPSWATRWLWSRPPRNAMCAQPARSSRSTASWPPAWPSTQAGC